MYNQRLPSYIKYSKNGFTQSLGLKNSRAWYLGITENTEEISHILNSNYHVGLLNNRSLNEKFNSYLDIDLIPDKYKSGKSYYDDYETQTSYIFPNLDEASSLKKDKKLIENLSKLFNTDISPGLADLSSLKGLPKALVLVCEFDTLKDENLIYAERLKMAGVNVETEFYEEGFHGVLSLPKFFNVSHKIINDIITFLNDNM